MTQIDVEPPSKQDLLKTTAAAGAIALAVLIFFVLPAEFGIDPTGFGGAIGLTHDDPGPADVAAVYIQDGAARNETFVIEVPNSGAWRETKFDFEEGMTILFSWQATGVIQFDLHNDAMGSFDAGQADARHGSFTAPADGAYGWAWRAVDGESHQITLTITGHWS